MKLRALVMTGFLSLSAVDLHVSSLSAADGPLANATVSFGHWRSDREPPVDRVATPEPMGPGFFIDELSPKTVIIKQGGAVNFIISGLHNVAIYDDGTKPEDIIIGGVFPPLTGAAGGIIDDPTNRIYRGFNPNSIPNNHQRDRVEVVNFAQPGTYLVICGVVNHFVNEDMFGYVRVLPGDKK